MWCAWIASRRPKGSEAKPNLHEVMKVSENQNGADARGGVDQVHMDHIQIAVQLRASRSVPRAVLC